MKQPHFSFKHLREDYITNARLDTLNETERILGLMPSGSYKIVYIIYIT
jgi:hypothetical protein